MKTLNYTNLLLSTVAVLALSACDNNGTTNKQNNGNTPPVVQADVNEDAPIITLQGKNPLYLQHGHIYREPGATALDDVNGDVEVKVSGNVDAFTIGTYYVTYTSKDFDGNTATTKRKVIVQPITHHGLTYKPVISPTTKRIWLDRNIGASEVCTSYSFDNNHISCSGDTYQWGRNPDGHEQLNSTTTQQKGKTITDSGSKFVIGHNDWTTSTNRGNNWRVTDGRSVCPINYRVPSMEELKLDTKKLPAYGSEFSHFLKLVYGKNRNSQNGYENIYGGNDHEGFSIKLWTNTFTDKQTYILDLGPYASTPDFPLNPRAAGHPVRCIQN